MNELKLNDFASFNRYLFGDKEPDWGLFYDEELNIFTPPIKYPKTIEEFQLDHYVLWMIICNFELPGKPPFAPGTGPIGGCYACEYRHRRYCEWGSFNNFSCDDACPLAFWDTGATSYMCGDEYTEYVCAARHRNVDEMRSAAEKVAHMLWREV